MFLTSSSPAKVRQITWTTVKITFQCFTSDWTIIECLIHYFVFPEYCYILDYVLDILFYSYTYKYREKNKDFKYREGMPSLSSLVARHPCFWRWVMPCLRASNSQGQIIMRWVTSLGHNDTEKWYSIKYFTVPSMVVSSILQTNHFNIITC